MSKKIPLLILILALLLLGARSYYGYALSLPNGSDEEPISFIIEAGQGVEDIAKNLEQESLIRSAALFQLYASLSDLSSKLQAGEYQVPQNLNVREVVELLQHGTFEERLTFVEGWRREEMANEISNLPAGKAGLKSQISKLNADEFLRESEGLEGYLFPDTYFVSKETTAEDLVKMMRENFERKVESVIPKTEPGQPNLPGITFAQVVNVASIVEREAGAAEDKPIVAGILIKRFLNDWALQADATIQYALGYQEGWKKNLTLEDLEVDSPYNTYKNPGLPPTPICNPGLDSLEATLNPTATDYWYYVSDSDGRMHFAETIEEHNENVAKYVR